MRNNTKFGFEDLVGSIGTCANRYNGLKRNYHCSFSEEQKVYQYFMWLVNELERTHHVHVKFEYGYNLCYKKITIIQTDFLASNRGEVLETIVLD